MAIKIRLCPSLYEAADGEPLTEVNASTIGQCLEQLAQRFPNTAKWLFDRAGEVQDYLDIYVNGESAYPDALAKPVRDGDEINIIFLLGGG